MRRTRSRTGGKGDVTGRLPGRLSAGLLASSLALTLAACVGGEVARRARSEAVPPPAVEPEPGTSASPSIGAGAVKVALIVPLTGQGESVGGALRNAAELAYDDFQRPDLTILVKDDRGSADGAREAVKAALAEGAQAVLGPLFAANVAAVGGPARAAGRPVIAFSTDAAVAARGVYLISFLPQTEVDRIVEEAAASGRSSFAALIPETAYGNAVEAAFREAVARKAGRMVGLERYAPGDPNPAVLRLKGVVTGAGAQADALFLPGSADDLVSVAAALQSAGFSPRRVRPLGTAPWNDPRVLALPALQGGLFAAPDRAGFESFAQRYRARYAAAPPRAASLAYDAVALAAALRKQYGSQAFTDTTLTAPAGFSGLDGTFRFRPEGVSDRALAVYEIRDNAAVLTSPAPRALSPSGI